MKQWHRKKQFKLSRSITRIHSESKYIYSKQRTYKIVDKVVKCL